MFHRKRYPLLLLGLLTVACAAGCGGPIAGVMKDGSVLGLGERGSVLPDENELKKRGLIVVSNEPGILRVTEKPPKKEETGYVLELYHVAGANGRREVVATMVSDFESRHEDELEDGYWEDDHFGWIGRVGMLRFAKACQGNRRTLHNCTPLPGSFYVRRPRIRGGELAHLKGVLHVHEWNRFVREFGPFEPFDALIAHWKEARKNPDLLTAKDKVQVESIESYSGESQLIDEIKKKLKDVDTYPGLLEARADPAKRRQQIDELVARLWKETNGRLSMAQKSDTTRALSPLLLAEAEEKERQGLRLSAGSLKALAALYRGDGKYKDDVEAAWQTIGYEPAPAGGTAPLRVPPYVELIGMKSAACAQDSSRLCVDLAGEEVPGFSTPGPRFRALFWDNFTREMRRKEGRYLLSMKPGQVDVTGGEFAGERTDVNYEHQDVVDISPSDQWQIDKIEARLQEIDGLILIHKSRLVSSSGDRAASGVVWDQTKRDPMKPSSPATQGGGESGSAAWRKIDARQQLNSLDLERDRLVSQLPALKTPKKRTATIERKQRVVLRKWQVVAQSSVLAEGPGGRTATADQPAIRKEVLADTKENAEAAVRKELIVVTAKAAWSALAPLIKDDIDARAAAIPDPREAALFRYYFRLVDTRGDWEAIVLGVGPDGPKGL